jgi:hypothetical protein
MTETTRGVCRHCGCTDKRAGPGGCYWIDQEHTICSACDGIGLGLVEDAERYAAAISADTRRAGMIESGRIYAERWLSIVLAAQATLRSDDAHGALRQELVAIVRDVSEMFARLGCHAVVVGIRRGWEGTGCAPNGVSLDEEV